MPLIHWYTAGTAAISFSTSDWFGRVIESFAAKAIVAVSGLTAIFLLIGMEILGRQKGRGWLLIRYRGARLTLAGLILIDASIASEWIAVPIEISSLLLLLGCCGILLGSAAPSKIRLLWHSAFGRRPGR